MHENGELCDGEDCGIIQGYNQALNEDSCFRRDKLQADIDIIIESIAKEGA